MTVSKEQKRFLKVPDSVWAKNFDNAITVADNYEKKVLLDGHSLFNLDDDPFELDNLIGPDAENPEVYKLLIEEINEYIEEETKKGHVLPPIPGDENGKLYTRIFQKMGPVYGLWFLKRQT